MDLTRLQERLAEQYARLRDLRATENYPVYAIEHGLTDEEHAAARALLNADLNSTMLARRAYWLVWIAAAAEVGYRYDGTEYWDSFAASFPAWPQYGNRNQIREWFKRFAKEFRGLTPSGPWARHFPIIAWPITQAILPRYLQRHFAEHLYELRHALARSGELTLEEIGGLLSERYYGNSSRFEGFLQQKQLTARIILAIQREGLTDAVAPIEKATLDRIVNDFDKLGSFGRRLREAQRVLRDARFINSYKSGFAPKAKGQVELCGSPVDRAERPRLMARPVGADEWRLALAIPDLATPLRHAGYSAHDLERSRMRFRFLGEASTWIPGRALFSYTGQSEEPLTSYPVTDTQVFAFERPPPNVEHALRERLAFPGRALRLLKIRNDRFALEVSGRHVRANQSYIIVATSPFAPNIVQTLSLAPLQTRTSAAHLWLYKAPPKLSAAEIAALKSIELGYVLSARADPVGLVPRWNTANGALVLLNSETALFRLSSDVAVSEFTVALNADPPVRIKPSAENSTLLSICDLPIGTHRVAVSALGATSDTEMVADEILIEVRSALPWQRAIAGKAGVTLTLEPRDSTLEQFLNGTALISVRAPHGRIVKLDARFYGADGTLFHEETFGRYSTPISDKKLSDVAVQRLSPSGQVERLERAARIELLVSLDEYGSESISFEKDAEPLRWLRVDEKTVRLSDDSAEETTPLIEQYDLNAVESKRDIDYEKAMSGIELRGKGSLFVARLKGRRYIAIATTLQHQLTSLADLGVPATVSKDASRPAAIINALKQWVAARRFIGPMALIAQRNAIHALEKQLEVIMCGQEWRDAVNQVRAGTRSIGDLYRSVHYPSPGFAAGLRAFEWRYDSDLSAAEAEFLRLTDLYRISNDDRLARLALRLAFKPAAIRREDLPEKDTLKTLKANTGLICGAYFARLAHDLQSQNARSEAA